MRCNSFTYFPDLLKSEGLRVVALEWLSRRMFFPLWKAQVPKAIELTDFQFLLPLWLFLLIFFLAHWAAVVGYGPGRPPHIPFAPLQPALHALLAAGEELPRPTSAQTAWCRVCEAEKPPVVSHCHQCNRALGRKFRAF